MIVELIAAAVGTVAFALLFGVPRMYYVTCAWIGAVDRNRRYPVSAV